MTDYRAWFLRPDSPLVFRTGRPFGDAQGQGGGEVYDFPLPATIAGALRAAWCDAAGHEHGLRGNPALQGIEVRGPLRATLDVHGRLRQWLPAPADAMQSVPVSRRPAELLRLAPDLQAPSVADGCDLPYGLAPLRPRTNAGRAAEQLEPIESLWALSEMDAWLQPTRAWRGAMVKDTAQALLRDRRTHVAVQPRTLQADPGRLFFSEGLDFTMPAPQAETDHGLLLYVKAPPAQQAGFNALDGRHTRVGADGRTALCMQLAGQPLPVCSAALRRHLEAVKPGDLLRLVLATPGCYLRNGWYPDGLRPVDGDGLPRLRGALPGLPGWTFELAAAAVGRFVPHAGTAMRSAPGQAGLQRKPLRRLVRAGSVYWLRVLAREDSATPLADAWLQPTCYGEYARDGHGLALWGCA